MHVGNGSLYVLVGRARLLLTTCQRVPGGPVSAVCIPVGAVMTTVPPQLQQHRATRLNAEGRVGWGFKRSVVSVGAGVIETEHR